MKKILLIAVALIPLIFYGTVTYAGAKGTLPSQVHHIYDLPGGDKAGHLIIMGLISFAVMISVRLFVSNANRFKGTILTTLFLVALFTLEEFSQKYVSRRTFSLMDLWFSYGGTLIGIVTATLFTLKRQKEPIA